MENPVFDKSGEFSVNDSQVNLIQDGTEVQMPTVETATTKAQAKSTVKGTSCSETLMHMIKCNIGTGLLAIPLAFKMAGVFVGTIGLWFMGYVCLYCIHILLKAYKHVIDEDDEDLANNSETIGYDDVVYLVVRRKCAPDSRWPQIARVLVSTFLVIGQFGFCCVYFVFIPTNIHQVLIHYSPNSTLSIENLMAIILLPMIFFCLLRNLKYLAPFSTFANFLMIGSVVVILYSLFFDGSFKPWSELSLVAPFQDWPNFFSSAVYAFEGIGCVLPVYNAMEKNKKSFFLPLNGVLNTAMFLVAVMYYSIGFFGYIKYGDDCAASITINLPVENVIFQGVKLCFSVAVFITFNLQFLVGADIVLSYVYRASGRLHSLRYPTPVHNNVSEEDEQPLQGSKSKFLIFAIESSIRTLVILVIFALAIAVPRIDLFIALVGAVASSMLAIIIPSALDLWVFWPIEGYSKTKLITNVIFLVFGVYIFLAGTYTSMRDIIQYLIDKQ